MYNRVRSCIRADNSAEIYWSACGPQYRFVAPLSAAPDEYSSVDLMIIVSTDRFKSLVCKMSSNIETWISHVPRTHNQNNNNDNNIISIQNLKISSSL